MSKKPIPEDFELSSDEETKTITLTKEQRLMSKNIVINCPLCDGRIQLRNEIEINPKGISCKCNPCSFKLSKNKPRCYPQQRLGNNASKENLHARLFPNT